MTQPPYGYGPVPPGGHPVPPPPNQGGRPGYGPRPTPPPRHGQRPGYGPPPGYAAPQGYPAPRGYAGPHAYSAAPGYGPPQAYRPPMPPPMPYGPPGRAPMPPRKRGGGRVLALLLVVAVVVVGGLVRAAIRFDGPEHRATGPDPSFTYTPDGSPGVSETATNPLLTDPDATLLPADCDYAPWGTQVDTARRFFESAAACLEDAWQPVLAQVNLPFTPPALNVSATTAGISTPCTGSTTNFAAFYCPANKTIYMPISQLQTDLFKDNWVIYLSVFAHEYGHHVQAMSGILRKANSERVDAGTRSERGLELSRRIELQAQCFDGMYLGSAQDGGALTTAQIGLAVRDAGGRGDGPTDSPDHGSPDNSGAWFELGVEHNRTAQCNTFSAPAAAVG